MDILERLKQAGVDVDTTVARFMGNQDLYLRFIHKFPQDENMGALETALEAKDYDTMLTAAHTLKGVSANLGINAVSAQCQSIVTDIRAGQYERLGSYFQDLKAAYQKIVEVIAGA